jgi:hypothetical protein
MSLIDRHRKRHELRAALVLEDLQDRGDLLRKLVRGLPDPASVRGTPDAGLSARADEVGLPQADVDRLDLRGLAVRKGRISLTTVISLFILFIFVEEPRTF